MPSTHTTLTSLFNDIADAIRDKDKTSAAIVADTFPARIAAIDTDPSGDATATAADILSPKTAYAKGVKLTGTIETKADSGTTALDTTTTSKSFAAGYYPNAHSAAIILEEKSHTPTETAANITPTNGKVLSKVSVGAISPTYVGSQIPRKTSSDLTASGATITAPAGYYADDATKTIADGSLSAADSTLSGGSFTPTLTYNTTNDEFDFGGSANATGTAHAKVTTSGYVTNAKNTSKALSAAVSATGSVDKVITGADITGATTKAPTLARTAKPSGDTWIDAASGAATTTKPTSGAYVQIDAAANTGTLTATPKVTSAGYGDTTHYGATAATATVGAAKATTAYVPIKAGSATTPATTITTNPSVSWDSTNKKIKANYSGSQSVSPSVVEGYVGSGVAGTISTTGTTSVAAESLDTNLTAANVKSGTTIFNTTGTFSASSTITGSGKTAAAAANILTGKAAFLDGAQLNGTMANNGATGGTITTQGGTYTIPAGYTSGGTVTANIPGTTLTNAIIDGAAIEETTGDYGWQSTVTIPAGMHNAVTLTKVFSNVFPAPTSEGSAAQLLLGYQLYDHTGKLLTGTMPNNGAVSGSITTQGGTYTIPAGYHNGSGTVTATLATTSRTAGAGSVTLTAGAGSVSATGTGITLGSATSTQPSSGLYITAVGSGTVSGTGKGTVSTGTGYITSGSTTSNDSASSSKSSNSATLYYPVTQSSVTSGQTLPSGSTASGTAGYGKYAKVAAGYYATDRYIGSGVSAGSASASGTGSASITSLTKTYNSSAGNYTVSGSGSISGTATGTVSTAGYISSITSGSVSGTASVSTTLPKLAIKATNSGDTTKTPAIAKQAISISGVTDAASGNATTSAPSSGVYVAVQSPANTGTLTSTPSVTTAGYSDGTNHGVTTATSTVGANASAVTYVPITTALPAFDGGALNSKAATAAGTNVTLGTTDTYSCGITIVPTGKAGRDAVLYNGAVNGWVAKADNTSASAAVSQQSWEGTTYYVTGLTIPANKTFGSASANAITNNGVAYIGTVGTTHIRFPTSGSGTVSVAGTTVAQNGALISQAAATYYPSTSDQTISSGRWLTGNQTIKAVTHTATAAKIAAGQTVTIGDSASASRVASVTGTYTSDATATAADILLGKTAYVNGSKVTGTMEAAAGACTFDYSEGLAGLIFLSGATVNGDTLESTLGSVSGSTWTIV